MKRFLTKVAAALCAAGLAACGGGGSSSTPGPISTIVPASIPKAAQRSTMQTALTTTQTTSLLAQFGVAAGGTTATSVHRGILRVLQAARAGRRPQASSACTNSMTQTSTQTGPTTAVVSATYYYDTACTQPRELLVATIDSAAGTAIGNTTLYDTAGNVIAYATLQIGTSTANGNAVTIVLGIGKSASSTPYANLGLTCDVNSATTTLACGVASTSTLASGSMLGVAINFTGTDAVSTAGDTLSFNESVNEFTGALGALGIAAGTGYVWNVTGGTAIDTASITGTAQADTSGRVSSISLSATDSAYNLAFNLSGTTAGTTATETLASATLATARLDSNGNGTITYADGSQDTVSNYTIVS